MNNYVPIGYIAHQEHWDKMSDWCKNNCNDWDITTVMDTSAIGMSFWYSFLHEPDAIAFRLKFGQYIV
jgi:hypothetical protein